VHERVIKNKSAKTLVTCVKVKFEYLNLNTKSMKNKMKEFEEFRIENLQSLVGGEIINFNTVPNRDYPNGDNKDITYDEYGVGILDGFGGGYC
jgi:hypothetical protein